MWRSVVLQISLSKGLIEALKGCGKIILLIE
jgi:hypothetical protein